MKGSLLSDRLKGEQGPQRMGRDEETEG